MTDKTERFNTRRVDEYKLFDKVSFSWQYIEAPAITDGVAPYIKGDSVLLDLGCGTGRVLGHLVGAGQKPEFAYGIDISDEMVQEARVRAPSAHFLQGDIQDLPYADGFFDLVASNNVLHFLDDDELGCVLESLSRVLKTGGRCFFVESNPYQDPESLNLGKWVTTRTPWGAEISAFRHDYIKIFSEAAEQVGLQCVDVIFPKVLEEGRTANPKEYKRYSQSSLRIAATLLKV